jgi:hypothetical protein
LINTERVLIGCATKEKNIGNANLETEYLFRTINEFAGKLKYSKKLACFLEMPDEKILNVLNELRVNRSITQPLDNRNPPSHKIRIIEEAMKEDIDYIVMLDTDIVACRDFSDHIEGPHIKAAHAFGTGIIFDFNQWNYLFEFFGLELCKKNIPSGVDINTIIPYCNSGVLIIPIQHARKLFSTWKNYVHKLCDNQNKLPNYIRQKLFFFEQIAFSITLVEEQFPFTYLPREMNFDPIVSKSNLLDNNYEPFLIHHLHRISENGDIFHCAFDMVNKKIDLINEYLQKTRKIQFDNDKAVRKPIIFEILFRQGDFPQIIRRLSTLTIDNKDAKLQFHLAHALHMTGQKLNEALDRYCSAIENGFPNPLIIYSNRGSLYFELGNLEKAKSDFEAALNIMPHNNKIQRKLLEVKKRLEN